MLTEHAQPTSAHSLPMRVPLSAACALRLAIVALVLTLCLLQPFAAGARGSTGSSSGTGTWPWPIRGEVITPYKNGSDPYAAGQHRGLDIAAPTGASVLAIVGGRVSYSGRLPDGGQAVTIAADGGRWLISHLHLATRSVKRGERVVVGQKLGAVGTSGRRSATEPHLHLSVREAGTRRYVDPLALLGAQRVPRLPQAAPHRQARPQITSLERAQARSQNVRAPQTGDASSATRHGAEDRQNTRVRSVDASAREGHAADGISRVAPPPLKSPEAEDEPVQKSPPAPATPLATTTGAVATEPATARTAHPRRRAFLFAIAVVCIAALVMRGRPPQRPKVSGAPACARARSSKSDDADVIPIRRAG